MTSGIFPPQAHTGEGRWRFWKCNRHSVCSAQRMSASKHTCGSGFSQGLIKVCSSKLSKLFFDFWLFPFWKPQFATLQDYYPQTQSTFHSTSPSPGELQPKHRLELFSPIHAAEGERLMCSEAWLDGCIWFKVHIRSPCVFSQCLWNFQPSI